MTVDSAIVKGSISEFVKDILGDKAEKSKIAILAPVFSKFDGVGRVAEQQAKELSENGYVITVFALEADMNPLRDVKLEIFKEPKNFVLKRIYRTFLFLDVRTIKWGMKLKRFDLAIAHQYPMTYLACLTKKLCGVKFLFYNHGHDQGDSSFHSGLIEKSYLKICCYIEDWAIKSADYVISISKFLKEELKEEVGLDSVVIYDKIDTEKFGKWLDNKIVRDRHNIGEAPLILFVGRIVPHKSIHLLIEALKRVKKEIPNTKLIIVGKSYYKPYFKKLMEMSDDSVIFAGYVPDEDMPYYYVACDVYATCTLWEGFNLPLVEAQACGKPVVAFEIGPHPEIINEKGTLVEPGNIEEFAKACIYQIKRGGRTK